jgi:tripartite-type tricarboxylate transporter receptor subunit TctC
MIVPFGAGGPVDAVARFISHRLEAVLNKPFVVDNRAGASGNIGAAALSRAKPDGHTIMIATPFPMGLNKFMSSNLSFDPQVDFTPVIMIGKSPQIFLANADSPVKSMKQLVDAAKKSPGSLNVGTPGIGTTAHIAVEYFQSIAGVKLTPVHFRTSASLTSDLIGGHVEFATNLVPGFAELVKAGKVRALAVTSDRRSAQLPEVPTMIEQGFAGFDATAWYVLAVPAHTPPDVIAALNANVNAYLASDLGKKQLGDFDVQVLGGTPQDAKAFIDGELAKWEPIIKSAGIKME